MNPQAAPRGDAPPTTGLCARGLSVRRGGREVLQRVDVTLEHGWTAIVGPNGAGKSTLLRALAGLLEPSAGEVWLRGRPLHHWTSAQQARERAWLPQGGEPTGELTVRETVALGRIAHLGLGGTPQAVDHAAVDAALQATDSLAWEHRRLLSLSGGERQRVLLARALATGAPVLMLDEPTTHLDPPHQIALARLLRRFSAGPAADGTPPRQVLTVLHDLPIALQADHLWVMDSGRVVAAGPASQARQHRAVEAVFGGAVRIAATADGAPRVDLALDDPLRPSS